MTLIELPLGKYRFIRESVEGRIRSTDSLCRHAYCAPFILGLLHVDGPNIVSPRVYLIDMVRVKVIGLPFDYYRNLVKARFVGGNIILTLSLTKDPKGPEDYWELGMDERILTLNEGRFTHGWYDKDNTIISLMERLSMYSSVFDMFYGLRDVESNSFYREGIGLVLKHLGREISDLSRRYTQGSMEGVKDD